MTSFRTDITELVAAIIKENPNKKQSQQETIFKEAILRPGYQELLDYALKWVFSMEYKRAQKTLFPPSTSDIDQRILKNAEMRKEDDIKVASIKTAIIENILDMQTAIGKTLRNCTGSDCAGLGGFYAALGERVGTNSVVGDVLSESDVQTVIRDFFSKPSRGTTGKVSATLPL